MAASPSILNYQIPTGKAYFKKTGTSDYVDLGNVVDMTLTNDVQKKEHFRNYGGRRTKDKTSTTQVGATVKFTLDEITGPNLEMFALGDATVDTDGTYTITGLTNTNFTGSLMVVGDNDEGPQVDWVGDVSFNPAGDFSFVKNNDDYNTIAFEADVQEDMDGNFGVWTVRESA